MKIKLKFYITIYIKIYIKILLPNGATYTHTNKDPIIQSGLKVIIQYKGPTIK